MDEATRTAIDNYGEVITKDEYDQFETGFGIVITYKGGVETYRPFCVARHDRQMNPFEPEDYATMQEAEAHIRTFLGAALAREQGRRDRDGKIIRQATAGRR